MATTIRKNRLFRLEPEQEMIESERRKPPLKKPKPRKKLEPFKRQSDRYSFAHLAKVLTGGERTAMLNAVDRLKGRARVLLELACFSGFSFVRLAAISYLGHDPDALVEIAKYCQYDDTRAAAVDELSTDNKALVEIACSSLFKDTRLSSVSLLADSGSLAEVASHSPRRDSRVTALEKISNDSSALKKVAHGSSYRSARVQAVESLASDTESLCSLIVESDHRDVKKAAASLLSEVVEELDDADALVEIAKVSHNEDARYLAIGRLSYEPWALRTIIQESRHRESRSAALMLLSDIVSELDDPEMLAEVAIFSPYEDCRAAAVERLVGQSSALLSVATKSKFKDTRDLVVEKLEGDAEALKAVSKLSKYRDTRKKAHKRVSDPKMFGAELGRILG